MVSACPQKKRGLAGNERGKDVQAVQRAVGIALEQHRAYSQNARNGVYGEGTLADVRAWQRKVGIEPTGKLGQPTLGSLWPYFDAFGQALYFRARIGEAPELPQGQLRHGQEGPRVRALQQMLWRALGSDAQNIRNGVYGDGVSADVRRFARVAGVDVGAGRAVNQALWEMLFGFGDDYARAMARGAPGAGLVLCSNLITFAELYVAASGTYLQARPYQRDVPMRKPLRNDCSGSVHHLHRLAGGPDPSGRLFDGYGYTGTMQARGVRRDVAAPAHSPGTCFFYGGARGRVASHVAMLLDQGRLFTFGHTPPTITEFAAYWREGLRYDVGGRIYIERVP